jgi:hypothetical protein
VLVDCCSADGSLNYFRDLARRERVQIIVTHPDEPFVYALNCNPGAQVAEGRYLVFANNDIEAKDPDLMGKLARCLSGGGPASPAHERTMTAQTSSRKLPGCLPSTSGR